MILWRLGGHSTSCWYIPFFFWAFAFGQSIRFATNRKIFVILLQILVFVLSCYSNVFQGFITSVMITQEKSQRMTTFDELLESNLKILVEKEIFDTLRDNFEFQVAMKHGRILTFPESAKNPIKPGNFAAVIDCEMTNFWSSGLNPKYYMINVKFLSHFPQLHVSYLNKYLRRWQLTMDKCFEAGLPKAWDDFEGYIKIPLESDNTHKDVSNLEDVLSGFYALIIGWILAFLALICEIFYNDCLMPCIERWKMWKTGKLVGKNRKIDKLRKKNLKHSKLRKVRMKRKVKVRFIQVKPAGVQG